MVVCRRPRGSSDTPPARRSVPVLRMNRVSRRGGSATPLRHWLGTSTITLSEDLKGRRAALIASVSCHPNSSAASVTVF